MTGASELVANSLNACSIWLAGRNSVHTWWTGIAGGLAFAFLFYSAQLYADVTLQVFFIATSVIGWARWRRTPSAATVQKRISRVGLRPLALMMVGAIIVALTYGWILERFTNAFAPAIDSVILVASVLGQILLIDRRLETWWCWILANTLSVPLYFARGLHITAALYLVFWINAWVSLRYWRRQMDAGAN